ncbi:MAG: RNA polymerase sigma factor [Clostridiales bacterium]|nr:RNA polymerase sigma factor [Clostridiales bacterium]
MLEQRLIQRIQQGDRDALNSLIKEYYQSVFAYFYRNTRDYHKSNDLTQDVFIKVVSGIDKYDNRGRFKAWLFTVACNVLRNQWRHDNLHTHYELTESDAAATEDHSAAVVNKIRLEDALSALPAEQRDAVILKYYHDLKIREIAEITGVAEATVKSRLNYALKKLGMAVKE